MPLTSDIQQTLARYSQEIMGALRYALERASGPDSTLHQEADTQPFYGQMQYHLGWVDAHFAPVNANPGKLLRPTLLLLAYEAAGAWGLADEPAYLRRALPAAASIELTHNFTLIHDDIEDGDAERRHRTTLWKLWDIPHAINTGDGMFALARLALWDVLDEGVEGDIAARLGAVLDRACLVLAEGQYLDISFEKLSAVSVTLYLDMIHRKTAALMSCAAEMGAMLGTRDPLVIESLRDFGLAMGIAFQVRDDLLGIWASAAELGKTPAGDIYRRKKSLPILHALEHANQEDRALLQRIYAQEASLSPEQVKEVLSVFEHTRTHVYCQAFLAAQCHTAREKLERVPRNGNHVAARALHDMETLVKFVEALVREGR